MARSDKFELNGVVTKSLPGTKFEVEMNTGTGNTCNVVCTLSGKLRQNFIRIIPGDHVTVEMSPYDLTKGIITWRTK